MILATKSGWLIIVKVVEEKRQKTVVKDLENEIHTVRKSNPNRKLFAEVQSAVDWINTFRRT